MDAVDPRESRSDEEQEGKDLPPPDSGKARAAVQGDGSKTRLAPAPALTPASFPPAPPLNPAESRSSSASKRKRASDAVEEENSAAKVKCEPQSEEGEDIVPRAEETFYFKSTVGMRSKSAHVDEQVTRSGLISRRPLTRSQATGVASSGSSACNSDQIERNADSVKRLRKWTFRQASERDKAQDHCQAEEARQVKKRAKLPPPYEEQTLTALGSEDSLRSAGKASSAAPNSTVAECHNSSFSDSPSDESTEEDTSGEEVTCEVQ